MLRKRAGLVVAMEDEVAAIDAMVSPMPQSTDTVSVDLVDVMDEQAEQIADVKNITELCDIMVSLEAIDTVMRTPGTTIGKGGEELLAITLNHLSARAGIAANTNAVSMESYKTPAMALEGIGEFVTKIWDTIVKAIKDSIEWVKDFFSKIFNTNEQIVKRVDKLEARVKGKVKTEDSRGFTMDKKTIDNVNLRNALCINGHYPGNFDSSLTMYQKIANTMFNENNSEASKFCNEAVTELSGVLSTITVEEVIANSADGGKFIDAIELPKVEIHPTHPVTNSKDLDFTVPDTMHVVQSDETFGDCVLEAVIPKEAVKGKEAVEALRHVRISMRKTVDSKHVGDASIPILDEGQCNSVFTCIRALSNDVRKFQDIDKASAALKQKLVSSTETFINKLKSHAGGEEVAGLKKEMAVLAPTVKNLLKLMDQPGLSLMPYVLRTNNALLTYVEESLNAMG